MPSKKLTPVERIKAKRLAFDKKIDAEIYALQNKCKHENIIQTNGYYAGYGNYSPRLRACRGCGWAEIRTSTGYWKLAKDHVHEVLSEDFFPAVLGLIWDEDNLYRMRYPKRFRECVEKRCNHPDHDFSKKNKYVVNGYEDDNEL